MNEQPECCTMYADHVFVFGSNEAGRMGKGAALHAAQCHGAARGMGEGYQPGCRSYAIPTKDARLRTLPLERIGAYVEAFLKRARLYECDRFYVTAIGTGWAGYRAEDIAPMFADAPPNCVLPDGWRK